jgi:hypothetical protein
MKTDAIEKHKLIFDIFEDVNGFMNRYRDRFSNETRGKGSTGTVSKPGGDKNDALKRQEKSLFYLAFSLRDALASLINLCDPAKENIGAALLSTEYWERIKIFFPEHAQGFSS